MNTFLLIFVAAAVVWTVVAFNRLVARRNLHRSAWSDIDVQLLRRHELVPQLVDVVRAHAAHEKDTLTTKWQNCEAGPCVSPVPLSSGASNPRWSMHCTASSR
jgi:hypothetical protein